MTRLRRVDLREHPMSRNLARSNDGRTIHRVDCRHARVPWWWADKATDDEVLWAKLEMGYLVCKICQPDFRRSDAA